MIPREVVDRIREAADIVAVVRETIELHQSGLEWRGLCPFHDDTNPSLLVNPEKRRWFCHPCGKSGDVFAWLIARDGIGFPDAVRALAQRAGIAIESEAKQTTRHGGVTVAQWVSAKKLDPDLVRALNITDTVWKGAPAVAFPYYIAGDEAKPVAVHIRRSLEKREDISRFEWRPGDKPIPYGLWCLGTSSAKERGLVVLVEGESDFICLLAHNIPALGIPGNAWRETWSPYLNDIPRILVAVEPDTGGERLVESLSKSSLWPRCSLIKFDALTAKAVAS